LGKELSAKHNFIRQPIGRFLKNLGSDSVSPGGGAAASLTGALGASLIEMVSRINGKRWLKKQAGKTLPIKFLRNILLIEKKRVRFAELVRLDTEAFLRLSQIPKEKRQGAAYENTLKLAVAIPIEICELAVQVLEIGQSEVDRTSRWLASDLAEAGILLQASFQSGRLNVEINLKSIKDTSYISEIQKELDELQEKVIASKKKLFKVLKK